MARWFPSTRRHPSGSSDGPAAPASDTPAGAPDTGTAGRFGRWRRWWTAGVGAGIILTLVVIGIVQGRPAPPSPGELAGTAAPDFTLPTLDGTPVSLAQYRGRPVVLNLWASWCAPCRTEAPVLTSVARAKADTVTFIGVDTRDQMDDARAFIAEYGVPYLNLSDPAGSVEQLYGGIGIPYTIFIAPDGTIARTWLGPLDERRLLAFIDELS